MITNTTEKLVVSSLGWVDKGSLWILNTDTDKIDAAQLSDANYLSLHTGKEDCFSVLHHFDNNQLRISAHSASEPERAISNIFLEDSEFRFEGNDSVWQYLPKAYVSFYVYLGVANYWLFIIDNQNLQVSFQQFEWFDDSYDHGYQGIVGVTEVPNSEHLLISVQRDSQPVLYDLNERLMLRKIELAGNYGNPKLRFSSKANELWADDYDTILKLNSTDWSVIKSRKLQEAAEGVSQFIGDFEFNKDESLCAVARPYSGDVVALDTESFKIRYSCKTGGQPLQVAVLVDNRVFARDWQTGELLKGRLKRRFFNQ
jgi:hypothetical protein